jgi:hypothetical protein
LDSQRVIDMARVSISKPVCGTMKGHHHRRADRAPGRCRTGAASAWPRARTGQLFSLFSPHPAETSPTIRAIG